MRWSRMFFVLILIAWVFVLLGNVSASNSENPGGRQSESEPTAQYQSAAQQRSATPKQDQSIDINQQTSAAEQKFRQETLRIAREQLRIAQEQERIAADQTKTATDQVKATQRQTNVYQWLLIVSVVEAFALVGTLLFTGVNAKIANRTMILVHRPRLSIRYIRVHEPDLRKFTVAGEWEQVRFFKGLLVVRNVGGTTATIVDAGCWVFRIEGDLPIPRPYDDAEKYPPTAKIHCPRVDNKLLPGDDGIMDISQANHPVIPGAQDSLKAMEGSEIKQTNLYVMGRVRYHDDLGNHRHTLFCRRWDWKTQFLPVTDPEYEDEG